MATRKQRCAHDPFRGHPNAGRRQALVRVRVLVALHGAWDARSFWGFSTWDADADTVISQADVLRTLDYMKLVKEDGHKLITQLYSGYFAAA